jgi:uncharacterized protein YecE (DUF72 family)
MASIHVGTSGWVYADWCGRFYPEKLPARRRLEHYARHFDTVEINATHYRLATPSQVAGWNAVLPETFHTVAKGSAFLTHRIKLAGPLLERGVARFFEPLSAMKTLRVVLWQLPQIFPRDLERLDRFFSLLPRHVRHALEPRDPWWWNDEVAALLRQHEIAFCAVSHPALPADVVPTTDFLYVRFHGLGEQLYHYKYTRRELTQWVDRLAAARRGRALYAFFNNDWVCNAIADATVFRALLSGERAPRTGLAAIGITGYGRGVAPALVTGSTPRRSSSRSTPRARTHRGRPDRDTPDPPRSGRGCTSSAASARPGRRRSRARGSGRSGCSRSAPRACRRWCR